MEKISKRASAIEEVNNNVKLLTEMVMNHSQGGAAARSSEGPALASVRLTTSSIKVRRKLALTVLKIEYVNREGRIYVYFIRTCTCVGGAC